ncbi:MAG: hypothetical protein ACXQS5_04765 [Candidatus Methanospirareceae archaeon]
MSEDSRFRSVLRRVRSVEEFIPEDILYFLKKYVEFRKAINEVHARIKKNLTDEQKQVATMILSLWGFTYDKEKNCWIRR